MAKKTVLVAMSGGVDSSLAAALLVEQGHRVIGATMKTFCYSENAGPTRTCCGLEGIMDARQVCQRLGIPHYVFDMEEAFTRSVVDDFVSEYAAGRTPNPCVRCNSNTKIPDLLRRARLLGADAIATGHYARMEQTGAGTARILRAHDARKDQTYFLWAIPREVVPHLWFPVGELAKPEVRAGARERSLATADKPESQEICFVPNDDYASFLAQRLGPEHPALNPGPMVNLAGEVVGEHHGYARYTVGQRRGLGGGSRLPLYVIGVRAATNEVVVGTTAELQRRDLRLGDLNWIAEPPAEGDQVEVQIRYRAPAVPARVTQIDEAEAAIVLEEPQRAVTPGQSGVIYRGDQLLGGGRIR
jgi:tRNA-specific 2-thiouridylase